MNGEAKKPGSAPTKKPSSKANVERSGGVNIKAGRVKIGGHVVGRDLLINFLVNLPRSVQIFFVTATAAIVVIAIVLIASQPPLPTYNTEFIFDASEAMADPERLSWALGTFREELGGDAALVESIKAAASDLPSDPQSNNNISIVSAGPDACLIHQKMHPCIVRSNVAQNLAGAGFSFR